MDTVVINAVTKKFGQTVALDALSLTIPMGQMTGIVGADAAGKTTLLRIIIGLLEADTGSVATLGLDPATQKKELTARIGYMPQKFGLYEDLTVRENLEFYADLKEVAKDFSKLLDFTGLEPFQDRLAGKLSGGMNQKLGLGLRPFGRPRIFGTGRTFRRCRPYFAPGFDAPGQNYHHTQNYGSLVYSLFGRSQQLRQYYRYGSGQGHLQWFTVCTGCYLCRF